MSAPAQAALPITVAPCAVGDIDPAAQACLGFYGSQLLSGEAGDIAVQKEALASLGFVWDGVSVIENILGLNGADPTFVAAMNGLTFIGIHWGGGDASPVHGQDTTSFYRLDAGTDLHTIGLNYGSSSDAKLYFTTGGGVPEPATWGLMSRGFGGVGALVRRKRAQPVFAH